VNERTDSGSASLNDRLPVARLTVDTWQIDKAAVRALRLGAPMIM